MFNLGLYYIKEPILGTFQFYLSQSVKNHCIFLRAVISN